MHYSFRIRVNRSLDCTIQTDLSEINIPVSEANISLFLRAVSGDKSIKDAEYWALFDEGYTSEREAEAAGKSFQDALMITLAKMKIGVDFGERSPQSGIGEYLMAQLGKRGQRVLTIFTGCRSTLPTQSRHF